MRLTAATSSPGRRAVAHVAALELIGLVRGELLDRECELAVVLQRLDEVSGELLGDQRRHGASVGVHAPPGDSVSVRHEIAVAGAAERNVGVLLQEPDDLSGDHDVSCFLLPPHSSC
jgi:hypothetical protein